MANNQVNQIENQLFHGDNLAIIKNFPDNSVDLIYLDPPFNSKKTYYIENKFKKVEAFCDSWTMDAEKQWLFDNMTVEMEAKGVDSNFIQFWQLWIKALRMTQPKLLAYLLYMTMRLLEMWRILKPTGSIYLHCDPTCSHYIKIILDGIFGHGNFRNEIIWSYQTGGISKRWFGKKHDVIFFYSKTNGYFIDLEKVKEKRAEKSLKRAKNPKGARLTLLNEHRSPFDVWNIQALNAMEKERLGYPTQKPIALLDRIIKASCPENGIVLDPFCGCGTTIYATHEANFKDKSKDGVLHEKIANRKWVGIDIAILSTQLVKDTLKVRYNLNEKEHYK